MTKSINFVVLLVCCVLFLGAPSANAWGPKPSGPKYVFYFIGDGLASVQIQAAEAYLANKVELDEVPGSQKAELLTMSQFPVNGMSTTYANNRFITGSAAAGTALACGEKTDINVIAKSPDLATDYKSLATAAKEKGMKVGIVSSVSIDHATPAVFYSNVDTRKMQYTIGHQLVQSNFDYFAGGSFRYPDYGTKQAGYGETDMGNVIDAAVTAGWTLTYNVPELEATIPGQKVIATTSLAGSAAMPYALDRPADNVTLKKFTEEGIRLLDNPNGFFMMVEGGKIDWACHANDARSAIDDTLAFDEAIKVAYDFYLAHPNDTLIVVTGDHECGGMTIGFAGTGYATAFEKIENQSVSYEAFAADLQAYAAGHTPIPLDMDFDIINLINDRFGLNYNELNDFQKDQLENAFDKTFKDETVNRPEEDNLLYGYYDPLTVTVTHLLNQEAGIAWTSYSHTGVPVPVLAVGSKSNLFHGFYDNTDIAKNIANAMGVSLN